MSCACSEAKALYFVGAPIKNLMNQGIQDQLKVVVYQVAQEGIHFLAPHIKKWKIFATYDDFGGKCIELGTICLEVISDEFAESVQKLEPGSSVVVLEGYKSDVFQKLFLVMWRCRGNAMDCLVAKVEMEE
jgi:hypothetical protein